MRNRAFLSVIALAALGCGGGGSGSNLVARAPSPTCTQLARGTVAKSQGVFANKNVIVPRSTLESAATAGLRAHTNHLILVPGRAKASSSQSSIQGYTPAQIRNCYSVVGQGSGAIAVIVANHSNTSLTDFNTFSSQFGLPQEPSSDPTLSTNSRFQVVYSNGSQPAVDTGWAQEMALDIEWAHAMAPNAKIYLVEAPTTLISDLMDAVTVAKGLPGVAQISMSFGATETGCQFVQYDGILSQPGITFYAAGGDTAGERDFPALSTNSVSVGGTTLQLTLDATRSSEVPWAQTGGARSQFEPRPIYQDAAIGTITGYRSGNDIAVVGDPQTGVAVYSATVDQGVSGWFVVGGTSAGTPIVAGMVNASSTNPIDTPTLLTKLYSNLGTNNLFDITATPANPGWDIPTGVGAPVGGGAF